MQVFNQLSRRIRQLFTRGLVRMVDTQTLLQTMQVELLGDEVLDGVEHAENYGFTSCPKQGAEVITASVGGSRANTIIISAFDRRFRVKGLDSGEVAIYTDEGDKIHFYRGNKIGVESAGSVDVTAPNINLISTTKVVIESADIEIEGVLSITGDVSVTGVLDIAGIDFSTHVHGGVLNGGGSTGPAQ